LETRGRILLVLLSLIMPYGAGSHEINDSADVSTLESGMEPPIKISVGGQEMGGAVLMGNQAPLPGREEGFMVSATAQATAQSALDRAERGQLAHFPVGSVQLETDRSQAQLGESSTKKMAFSYEDTNWDQWETCIKGTKQSPVDLQRPYFGAFNKLQMKYEDQLWPVQENDGVVLRVAFKDGDGSVLGIGDKEYTPKEAIFRSPSEHKLNGKAFDMEMQIMHEDTIGNRVAMSVLMEVSDDIPKDNFYIHNVFGHFFVDLPEANNKRRVESMNLKWILNEQMLEHYVHYRGSLTHPPCTEGVEWFILGRPWLIEEKWLENYKAVLQKNARPSQPNGGRTITSF